ncbi:hypothetical protein ACJIZ3_024591 [Penstemon smallii]|uniref:Uncharacterized protein n=1 Tax=Penstemon smallii TaxID=265156 RepID=A0ABD3TT71_9LAMI
MNHEEYSLARSSENFFLITSLLSFKAAVTRPDSGVQGSDSSLIFVGISNFSNRAVFAACMKQRYIFSMLKFNNILFTIYYLKATIGMKLTDITSVEPSHSSLIHLLYKRVNTPSQA